LRRRALLGFAAGALLLGTRPMNSAVAAQDPSAVKSLLYVDDALSRYGFPGGHPLGVDRQGAFMKEAAAQDLLRRAVV